jgi:hypothetical protein
MRDGVPIMSFPRFQVFPNAYIYLLASIAVPDVFI